MADTASNMPRRMRGFWLTAAVAMLIAIAGYSYLDSLAFREAAAGAEQSRIVIEQANRVHRLLVTAEAGQRGYLLTGDPEYLADYQTAVPNIQLAVPLFAAMKAADEEDRTRLPGLIAAKLAELEETVRTRQRGENAEAMALQRSGRGKQAMDEIRETLTRMLERENARFREYSETAQRHGFQTRVLVQLFALLLAGFIWLSGSRFNRLAADQEALILVLQATREREAEGRAALATTLRSIGDAVIATDALGRVDFMNPVAESLTGYSSVEVQGRPLPEVFRISDEVSQEPSPDIAAVVLRDGVTVGLANHTVLSSRNGQRIPIDDSAAPIHDDLGKITGVVLVFRDVTQRRAAQRSLEESESRYRLLFESNPQSMWVYEIGTLRFLAVNEAAIARYGYTREEFLGMTLRDIRPREDVALLEEHTRIPERTLHTDGPWRHLTKSGAVFFVEVASHPIQFGGIPAKLVMSTDITDRMRLEEDLRQSQKLEAVGQLAGGIAHDFNNLLTVIEGYAELIRGDLTDDRQRVPLNEILTAAQRAASLTRQLLAFSRRQILQPLRLNLNANVRSTHRMLSRLLGEQIRIQIEPDAQLWDVFADPGQIDQIILNLAVNARDAMERGGTLTIHTANLTLGSSVGTGLPEGEFVRLSVSDTGEGMDDETQGRIFEPFFTTKEVGRGTGLGLSTVYGIVKQSGGYIQVASVVGQGSTFSIYLPRAAGSVPAKASVAPESESGGPDGEAILVVEDDANIRHLVASMLIMAGYRVLTPETSQEALAICRDASVGIDMLLTDVVLPEIDGLEVAQQAVRARPRLRVLFMSGYTEHPVLRLPGFDHGAPFLQKPFTKAALLAKVNEVLSAP